MITTERIAIVNAQIATIEESYPDPREPHIDVILTGLKIEIGQGPIVINSADVAALRARIVELETERDALTLRLV